VADGILNLRKLCAERAKVYHFDWAKSFEEAMSGFIKNNR
jgi:hypothetical protein